MSEMYYGIDISEFQEGIDIQEHNPEFVIIRYADGSYKDRCCAAFINQCRAAGIPYGLYYLIRSKTEDEARAEASDILKYISGLEYKPSVGIWADVEDRANYTGMVNATKTFCQTIQNAGYYAGIYCNWSYYRVLYPDCYAFDCWIADWNGPDPNGCPGTMQQYSNSAGYLDLDVSFVPLETYQIKKVPETSPGAKELIHEIRDKLDKLEALIK